MFGFEIPLNWKINLSFNSCSCSIWNTCVSEELNYTLLYRWISCYLSCMFIWLDCQREKGRDYLQQQYTGVSLPLIFFLVLFVGFCVSSFQHFCISFITASLWKKWDTLSKFTSSQGFSLPLRLESAICCKALGNNIEFEIHYSVLIRFILKNLCVHWPWLGKWYHKIRIFFSFSYSIIFSVARNGFVWQYTCKCQCICHLQLSGCSVRFPVIMSEKTVSATLNKMCLVKIASNFFSRHIMTW